MKKKPRSLLTDPFFKEVFFPWLLKSNLDALNSINVIINQLRSSNRIIYWMYPRCHTLVREMPIVQYLKQRLWSLLVRQRLWDCLWANSLSYWVGEVLALRLLNFWKWVCLGTDSHLCSWVTTGKLADSLTSRSWVTKSHCCSSVTKSCPTLCDPMDCSTPGFPVHHQLLELAQTHVHWVSDAIQSSHPLLPPSPPSLNLSQHQGLF